MSYIPDEYTPTSDEIDEVLSLYNEWLDDAYAHHGDKTIAIDAATDLIRTHETSGKVFTWVATNDAALIYDVDDTLDE